MNLELDGKVALVTGASRGLGFATALKLAQEGANVAINSRSIDHLLNSKKTIYQQTGKKVFTFAGDITNPETPKIIDGSSDRRISTTGYPGNKFRWSSVLENLRILIMHPGRMRVELSFLSHVRLIREALPYLRKSNWAKRPEYYFNFSKTTDGRPYFIQQHSPGNDWSGKITGFGIGKRWYSFQFNPAILN